MRKNALELNKKIFHKDILTAFKEIARRKTSPFQEMQVLPRTWKIIVILWLFILDKS
jgi:hypothetical protein